MTNENSRNAILRRRALFVSSAVAALACSHERPPAEPRATNVDVARPATSAQPSLETADAGAPDTSPAPSSGATVEIPDGIGDTARKKYAELAAVMRAATAKLDEIENLLQKECDLLDPKCDRTYRAVAEKFLELNEIVSRAFFCNGSSPEARAFAKVNDEQEQRYQERRRRLVNIIGARTSTPGAAERWKRHQEEAEQANPQPCLKFGCPDW